MARRLAAVLFLASLALAASALTLPAEPDASPTVLDRAAVPAPQRIASLSSDADEMLMGLAGPARLVCITYLGTLPDYSHIAESASLVPRHITHIADVEPIIALQPDLVVVNTFNRHEVVYLLQQAGLRVHRIAYPRSLAAIQEDIRQLGLAVGESVRAEALVSALEEARRDARHLDARARAAGLKPVRVLFLSGHFWAEGTSSLAGELMSEAGGVNVIEGGSRQVSPEEIVFLDPDLIVMGESLRATFASDPALSKLRARIEVAQWKDVQSPSQFAANALRRWAELLHPARAAGTAAS